jgi:hypothetical protein
MNSIVQLEASVAARPNSIEINRALAEAYAKEERWQEAANAYRYLASLYPDTASLFINRIRLGAIALVISSLLFLVSQILRPPFSLFHPYDLVNSLPARSISEFLFIPILILLSCAAISIYKLLSISNSNRPAFWAMVLVVVGSGMYLPLFGLSAVILPVAGDLYAQGDTTGFYVYETALSQPLATVFTLGGYLLFFGLTIFIFAIWRSGCLSKLASTMLWLGWSLFIVGDELFLMLGYDLLWWASNFIIFALSVTIGGVALAIDLWGEAALQLSPEIDFLEEEDS